MGARIVAVAVVASLALAGCRGEEAPDQPRDHPASGAVVLDKPWVFAFGVENENEWVDTYCYLRVTPETGESTTQLVPWNLDDSSHPGTLLDADGDWAIEGNDILEDPATVHSLTGGKDLTLELTKLTPRPTAWAFVPNRPGILHVLDADDTLVEYSLSTGKSRPVDLPEPPPGREYEGGFHAGTGMPVAVDDLWNGDDGRFRPHGITPIHVAGGEYAGSAGPDVDNAWPYGFKDRAGQSWKVESDEDTEDIVILRLQDEKWKQLARVPGACGSIEYVLPAAE